MITRVLLHRLRDRLGDVAEGRLGAGRIERLADARPDQLVLTLQGEQVADHVNDGVGLQVAGVEDGAAGPIVVTVERPVGAVDRGHLLGHAGHPHDQHALEAGRLQLRLHRLAVAQLGCRPGPGSWGVASAPVRCDAAASSHIRRAPGSLVRQTTAIFDSDAPLGAGIGPGAGHLRRGAADGQDRQADGAGEGDGGSFVRCAGHGDALLL